MSFLALSLQCGGSGSQICAVSKKHSLHTVFSHFLHKVLKDSFLLSLIGLALVHMCVSTVKPPG